MKLERIFAKDNINMKRLAIFLLLSTLFTSSFAQRGEDQSLKVRASTSSNPAFIHFEWPADNFTGNYMVYKRDDLSDTWGNAIATLPGNSSSFTDSNIVLGENYEYRFYKLQGTTLLALSYLYAGVHAEAPENMGHILLLIDTSYAQALSAEIDRLENDLKAEAWSVERMYVERSDSPEDIRSDLYRMYIDRSEDLKALFIIGHVPVPYSGDFSSFSGYPPPDGHIEGSGNHTGAWPSDSYYGDLFGTYTDASVNRTTGNQSRHHNVPGDGKFDQTVIPGEVLLEIGRVDFFNMPAFAKSDTQLLRDYFDRNHRYRRGLVQSIDRGVLDDNFTNLNLSSTGWNNMSAFFPADSIKDRPSGGDYFTDLKTRPYLWSYGCGAGSYQSCNGVGRTSDFVNDSLQHIFTMLAGSYFGDWDSRNNLMRASIANGALSCFWGGIPKWYVHTMALGMNIGQGTRATQNNTDNYFNGQFNRSENKIHIALMGDPSLRLEYLQGASNLSAVSNKNRVELSWDPAPGKIEGYAIYRVDKNNNRPFKIHSGIIDTSYFVDANNNESGMHEYLVRAVKYDTTASGSYENLSYGIFTSVNHTFISGLEGVDSDNIYNISCYPNPNNGSFKLKFSSIASEQIELSLIDINGRVIQRELVNADAGVNQKQFELDGVPSGLYLVTLRSQFSIPKSIKLNIQK